MKKSLLLLCLFLPISSLLCAEKANSILFIGSAQQSRHLGSTLRLPADEFHNSNLTDQKNHFLPPADCDLTQYGTIVIAPLSAVSPQAEKSLTDYVHAGGNLVWLYDSIQRTLNAGGGLGFGLPGFDGYIASHHVPYDQKTTKRHQLRFSNAKWGEDVLPPLNTIYCLFATDLIDAEAIVVDQEHPEHALLSVSRQGKGQVFFCGVSTLFLPLIIKYCNAQ